MWQTNSYLTVAQKNKSKIKLPKPHPNQYEILNDDTRFKILNCGRRFGKSTYLLIEAFTELLKYGHRVAYLSPTFSMLLDFWNELKTTLNLVIEQKSEQEKMLRLKNGGYFKGFSANNADVIRGGKYHLFLIDEAAIIPSLDMIWNNIVRQTLSDYEGRAVFASTPRGNNFFKDLYDRGDSNLEMYGDYKSFCYPSYENPYIKRKEILSSAQDISEKAFRQEILAEFIADAGTVFVGVKDAARGMISEPYSSDFLSIGLDLGRKNDYTVVSVYDGEKSEIVDYERFNVISWQEQIDRIVAFSERWGNPEITIETNNIGDVIFEMLFDRKLNLKEFKTTNQTKRMIIEAMASDIQWGRIVLPADPFVVDEFQTFNMKITANNNIVYGAPSGFHDDIVMSFCLARYGFDELITMWGGAIPILSV